MPVIGSRLGPYEVLAPIGAGGMGEVYRARDSRLNCDVTIKSRTTAPSKIALTRVQFSGLNVIVPPPRRETGREAVHKGHAHVQTIW